MTRGPLVVSMIFFVIWLVVIFFSSLQLNQQPDRERFLEGFLLEWFVLVGLLPIACCGAIYCFYQKQNNKQSVHESSDQDSEPS